MRVDKRACGLLLLILCGCIARLIRIQEKGLTCTEAHHIAINAVRRMGYTITETIKAVPGAPGLIIASRQEGTTTRGLMVSIFCTMEGSEVEARSDQGGLAGLNFSTEFRRNFEAAAANQPPPRPAAEAGVDVLLAPERGAGLAQLGVDLGAIGVLPVSVRITNHTRRAYRFTLDGVELQTAAGERLAPLKVDDLGKKLNADAARTLRSKALGDHDIEPNATLTGFLFFPFNAYTRARVELIDRASDESEGFTIEF